MVPHLQLSAIGDNKWMTINNKQIPQQCKYLYVKIITKIADYNYVHMRTR